MGKKKKTNMSKEKRALIYGKEDNTDYRRHDREEIYEYQIDPEIYKYIGIRKMLQTPKALT